MPQFELKEGRFFMSPNKQKTAEQQPDILGAVMLDGVRKRVACWIKQKEDGTLSYSGHITDFPTLEPQKPNEENNHAF